MLATEVAILPVIIPLFGYPQADCSCVGFLRKAHISVDVTGEFVGLPGIVLSASALLRVGGHIPPASLLIAKLVVCGCIQRILSGYRTFPHIDLSLRAIDFLEGHPREFLWFVPLHDHHARAL